MDPNTRKQVRAKAQRLSEWENMTDNQKTAVMELEKLKKALTMQVSCCRRRRRRRRGMLLNMMSFIELDSIFESFRTMLDISKWYWIFRYV